MDNVTQTTDTQGGQQTAAPAPDTQSNMTFVTSPGSTRLDEILSDLTGGKPAEPQATTQQTTATAQPAATGDQPTATQTAAPKDDDKLLDGDPNLINMRGDYLKRINALNAKQAELDAKEKALNEKGGTTQATTATEIKDDQGKSTGTPAPDSWKPKSNDFEWQEPGDKVLAEDIKTMAERNTSLESMVTKMYEVNAAMAKQIDVLTQNHHEQIADQISTQINGTVTQVKESYGLDLTPEQVATSIQKMSKIVLNGSNRLPKDFALQCWLNDPDNRAAYEAAVKASGGNAQTQQHAQTQTAPPAPLRQGGGRTQTSDGSTLSPEDQILRDLGGAQLATA